MNKYKYSRKYLVKHCEFDGPDFEQYLLATISPEEESQKIMMEQVYKPGKCPNCGLEIKYCECSIYKPDKECKHEEAVKWNEFNKVVQCHKCGEQFVPISPIKDSKPIKVEFEEIEEAEEDMGYWETSLETICHELESKINSLIRNQKKIITKVNKRI
jgi:methionyl-tRNA synthetase